VNRLALVAVLSLAACGGSTATPAPEPAPETSTPPRAPEATPDPEATPEPTMAPEAEPTPAVPATICERAHACCDAYVAALPSARRPLEERVCADMDRFLGEAGEATDEACEAAIGGWRQTLQLTGIEVPAACAEAAATP
jgi:hypothetical protein